MTKERLRAAYDAINGDLSPWEPSPRNIVDEDDKVRLLGDVRFQRAYMTYFSMDINRFLGNPRALAISHLFFGDRPLVFALFSGVGRPLTLLSDSIESRTALMVMQSLTLAAVEWMEPMREILMEAQLAEPPNERLSPEDLLNRVTYDGRFSGIMKAGPGFHGLPYIFNNAITRAAITEYVWRLDSTDLPLVLQQLSAISVVLSCGTHKPDQPAFDLYLNHLPTCVHSTKVILENWVEDLNHGDILVKGLWLLVVLTYITQLRPTMDGTLLVPPQLAGQSQSWTPIYNEIRAQATPGGRYSDVQLVRTLRSLRELARAYGAVHGRLYLHAAWKLMNQWTGWTGLGIDREVSLNIRL
ncbi:hypothetical protein N0V88_005611 [Collariella sp. IMI 366227]|nr:hypothetical protein N0V88_005611 [Collariella sp. IMI 366227]